MTKMQVQLEILAIQTDVEGMKQENQRLLANREQPKYNDSDFFRMSARLRELSRIVRPYITSAGI